MEREFGFWNRKLETGTINLTYPTLRILTVNLFIESEEIVDILKATPARRGGVG
jgi:hypothetical protein